MMSVYLRRLGNILTSVDGIDQLSVGYFSWALREYNRSIG